MANVELTSYQWHKILTFLRSRCDLYVGREDHCRCFVAGVLWIARSGAPWCYLPAEYGNWHNVYKRHAGWRDRGIWAALHHHLADDPDTEYLTIDSAIVRAHPDAAGAPKKGAAKIQDAQALGRSRGGFSTKVQITVAGLGSPLRFILMGGRENDITQAEALLSGYAGAYVIADQGYDAQWLRDYIAELGMTAVIPGRSHRKVVVYDPD